MYARGLIALLVFLCSTAEAVCHKQQVCDEFGLNCQAQDICDSTMDMPSLEMAPMPTLKNPGLKPLPSMKLPPLGTSECEYLNVNGEWTEVCH